MRGSDVATLVLLFSISSGVVARDPVVRTMVGATVDHHDGLEVGGGGGEDDNGGGSSSSGNGTGGSGGGSGNGGGNSGGNGSDGGGSSGNSSSGSSGNGGSGANASSSNSQGNGRSGGNGVYSDDVYTDDNWKYGFLPGGNDKSHGASQSNFTLSILGTLIVALAATLAVALLIVAGTNASKRTRSRQRLDASRPLREGGDEELSDDVNIPNSIEIAPVKNGPKITPASIETAAPAAFFGKLKRARGPYTFFTLDERPKIANEFPDATFVDAGMLMNERWSALSAGDRRRYDTLAEEDGRRFTRELERHYKHGNCRPEDVPSRILCPPPAHVSPQYTSGKYSAYNAPAQAAATATAATHPQSDPNAINAQYYAQQRYHSQQNHDASHHHVATRCLADQ